MQLRRLLALSGEVSGRLRRRSHSTFASPSRPAWAMVVSEPQEEAPELRATFRLAEPPRASQLLVPYDAIRPRGSQGPLCAAAEEATSEDGLLLLRAIVAHGACACAHATAPNLPASSRPPGQRSVARVVCNPLTGQLLRLPDIDGASSEVSPGLMGLRRLAHPSRRRRRAARQTGRWDAMPGFLSPLPAARPIVVDQPVVAFGGRLWWIDLAWGAVSVDPFADEPDFRFVELPRGRVLPSSNEMSFERRRRKKVLSTHRRVGVSEGTLRYVEVSGVEQFVVRSYVLDDDGSSWTMEQSTALRAQGAPFPGMPGIACIDPVNADVVYIMVGSGLVLGVDMERGMGFGLSVLDEPAWPTPCVLPPWLESTRIPSSTGV
ncbi:hypothetical protein OsJ_18863 [Oryza sativa Japonica Group]|uniref:DUF1618 domain-containing protein n=1 Tax=Oryza sativa subsp. japonica TaxID=39947 RepID=B9FJK5_ORYSJ|nr:hypothetical protein OsJ_18863 [Oryza sativa Japonica Group]